MQSIMLTQDTYARYDGNNLMLTVGRVGQKPSDVVYLDNEALAKLFDILRHMEHNGAFRQCSLEIIK